MAFPAKEVIFSDAAEGALSDLAARDTKIAAQIAKRVDFFRARLLDDVHAGELIPLPLPRAPRPLEVRHGAIEKLRCIDLPDGWRMLYSFYHLDRERYVVILEIVGHDQYSKWFPGRRRFAGTRA